MSDNHKGDWWDKLPGLAKIVIALGVVWGASATSTLMAQKWSAMPDLVEEHEHRIDALEAFQVSSQTRTTSHFVYISCMLQEIKEQTEGSRCDLVLIDEDRALLQGLRRRN